MQKTTIALGAALLALAACNKPAEPTAPAAPEAGQTAVDANTASPPEGVTPPTVPEDITKAAPAPESTTPAAPPAEQAKPAPAPVDPALARRLSSERVAYVCDNGETVELRTFPAQGVASLWRGGKATEMQQVKAYPPAFRYEAGPMTSVEGTPAEFTMQVGAMALTQCKVKE